MKQGKAGYVIHGIIMHCSATRPDWMQGASPEDQFQEIRRWHMQDRGWRDIGYHYVIARNGKIMSGRPISEIGAHVQGKNAGTIGICLIGGFGSDARDKFSEHFTEAQDQAARNLIAELFSKLGPVTVTGHNQYAAKACPGFNAPAWFNRQ